jgi:TPR repeat protein
MYRTQTAWIATGLGSLIAALFAGLGLPTAASAQSTPKVAVMPVEDASGKFDEETVRKATEYLRGGIAAADGYIVVGEGRQNEKLDELIDEKKKESYKECYDENCQIEVGKALAADTILRTEISHFGTCVLNVELIDLAREASVDGAQRKFSCNMEGLTGAVDTVMARLTGDEDADSEERDAEPEQTADEESSGDDGDTQAESDGDDGGPEDIEAARERGLTCYHRKRWDCARENLEPACEADHSVACTRLGWMYQWAKGVDRNYHRARQLYERACQTSDKNVGCEHLGRLYENGEGVDKDLDRARQLYEKACDKGPAGCQRLGNMYRMGKGVEADYDRARRLYLKACRGEDAIGCKYLADMYASGTGAGPNQERAFELYKRACDTGELREGCNHAGFRYEDGKGVEQNYRQAREYYERACEADGLSSQAAGCFNLGHLYEHGHEIPKDLDRARELYEKACIEGLDKACEIEYPLDESN